MNDTFNIDLSTIAFVATVHALGGVGLGTWLAERVPVSRRRAIGLSLMALAAMLHVPMRKAVMRGRQNDRPHRRRSGRNRFGRADAIAAMELQWIPARHRFQSCRWSPRCWSPTSLMRGWRSSISFLAPVIFDCVIAVVLAVASFK